MPDPSVTFRRLAAGDAGLLRGLRAVFADAFADGGTDRGDPPTDADLERLLAREHIIAVAALTEGRVLGGLVAYELDTLERMRREIYLYDLAVAPEYRRRRVATGAIDHLRGIAARRGAHAIFVQADRGDEPAIALYGTLGTRQEVLHFDLDVGPRRPPGRSPPQPGRPPSMR